MTSDHQWHRTLLTTMAARMRPNCFMELGLGTTPAIAAVADYCVNAYGVDTLPHEGGYQNTKIFQMSTDDFFLNVAHTLEPPDLVFIDADHNAEQVMKDFDNIACICADNCVVVLHDTFPENEAHTSEGYCGDSYLVPPRLLCEAVTLPFPPGITICRLRPKSQV